MKPVALDSLRIAPTPPAEWPEALTLAFAHLASDDRQRQVTHWTSVLAASQATLWGAYRDARLAAVMLVEIHPGRTATLAVPRTVHGEPQATACRLLQDVVNHLAHHRVVLAQSLLENDHARDGQVLSAAGFHHAADLLYLVSLGNSFPTSPPNDGLEFVTAATVADDRLAKVVEQTYEGSLDCPELDRVRKLDDVLAGYRAVGAYDPRHWFIAREHGTDVGCLLLADHAASDQWEIVYLGIVPAARGRGLGVALVRYAQWRAAEASRGRLITAVDAANAPAIAAYAAAGFVAWDRRSVFLRTL